MHVEHFKLYRKQVPSNMYSAFIITVLQWQNSKRAVQKLQIQKYLQNLKEIVWQKPENYLA